MMRPLLKLYLITWALVLLVSFFTADELPFFQRVLYTALLACVVPLLSLGKGTRQQKESSNAQNKVLSVRDCTIHYPLNPQILYRVTNGKVYRSFDVAPIFEIRNHKIYSPSDSKFAYRFENGKVYEGMSAAPFLVIRGDKIYKPLGSQVEYEIHY